MLLKTSRTPDTFFFFFKGQKNIWVKYIIAPSEEWVYNDEIAEKKIFFLRILRNKYFYSST